MKTFSFVILVLLLVSGKLFAKSYVPVSRWKTHDIHIDGNDRDWDKPINFYDGQTGLFFAIANDSSTLFLNFTATDRDKIQNLIRGVWTLALATKNKKSNTRASLTFEASQGSRGMNNRMGMDGKLSFGKNDMPDKKSASKERGDEMPEEISKNTPDTRAINDYILSFRSFKANGFIFTHDEVPFQNTSGVVVRVGQSDPAGLLYEIAIPLKELYEDESVKLNELISLVLTVNTSEQPEGEANNRPQGGSPGSMPGGGGGRPGGMSGGAPGGGGMGGAQMPGGGMSGERSGRAGSATEKVVFKQKFRLASH